jgi:hypothetical protein
MRSTTIKVPVDLRDHLASLAKERHATIAAVIASCLEAAEERQFWLDVAATMQPPVSGEDAAILASDLSDGLDPDETWDDVW